MIQTCKLCGIEFQDYASNKRRNLCSLPCYWKSKIGSGGYWKDKKRSEETKLKISVSKKGLVGFWKGKKRKPHSKETKFKLSIANKGKHPKTPNFMERETHWKWKGGVSDNRHKIKSIRYKGWVDAVFKRDNYTCQECGERGVYLQAHHIKGWAKYPNLRYGIDNGLTLCVPCHKNTDNYCGRG